MYYNGMYRILCHPPLGVQARCYVDMLNNIVNVKKKKRSSVPCQILLKTGLQTASTFFLY